MAGHEPTDARRAYDDETARLRPHLVADAIGWRVKNYADAVIREQDREIARLRTQVAELALRAPPAGGTPPLDSS